MDNSCNGISSRILSSKAQKDNPWAKSIGLVLVFLASWGIIYWAEVMNLPESILRVLAFTLFFGYVGALYYMCIQVNKFDYYYYENECDAQQEYSYTSYIKDSPCLKTCEECYLYKDAIAAASVFYSFQAQTIRVFKYSFLGMTSPAWVMFWIGFKIHNICSQSRISKTQASIKQTTT